MNAIEKLLRKISEKDRSVLLEILNSLEDNPHSLSKHIQKVSGTEFYRLKQARYRIIFHYYDKRESQMNEDSFGPSEVGARGKPPYYEKSVVVDSVRLRNEKTYKNL